MVVLLVEGSRVTSGSQHGISLWTAIFTTLSGGYFAFGPIQDPTRESKIKLYVRRIVGWIFFILGLLFLLGMAIEHTTYLQ